MYAATPNRLARQRQSDEKISMSEDESDSSAHGNTGTRSDEVAVYCRLRPLSIEENEVYKYLYPDTKIQSQYSPNPIRVRSQIF